MELKIFKENFNFVKNYFKYLILKALNIIENEIILCYNESRKAKIWSSNKRSIKRELMFGVNQQ